MSKSASYFRSSNNKDHIFGDSKLEHLKTLGSSLIMSVNGPIKTIIIP